MKSVKIVLVLTLIAVFSGGLLALWDSHTSPLIEANMLAELEKGIAKVLPEHDRYQKFEPEGLTCYVGYKDNQPVGVAFETSGPGFQGKVSVMVGLKPDFKEMTGIEVISQIETPGLGTKIVDDPSNKQDSKWFPKQYKGLFTDQPLEVVKNQKAQGNYQVEAITGATISSKAVSRIISLGVAAARPQWEKIAALALHPPAPEPAAAPTEPMPPAKPKEAHLSEPEAATHSE
ncbi:MAG: FMN-binding protein [bacterium]|nr:FMN-binding protein [bacterium]